MRLSPRSELLSVGESAPDFIAPASDGTTVQLSALRGQKQIILVFYPGDNTPVCTAQLCALRDDWSTLEGQSTVVYGINPASSKTHARFADKHRFPFPLLADPGGQIAAAYGCRMLFGLIRRTVYILDRTGRVAFAQRGNPAPAEIQRVLDTLQDARLTPTTPSTISEEA